MESLCLFLSDCDVLVAPSCVTYNRGMQNGQRDLQKLLRGMDPVLYPDEFVYCTMAELPRGLEAQCVFREAEGVTVITTRAEAELAGLAFQFPCRMISLRVHSALDGVGFLARMASELAEHGISSNVVSAYFHDHFFVPTEKAELAMKVLRDLAGR